MFTCPFVLLNANGMPGVVKWNIASLLILHATLLQLEKASVYKLSIITDVQHVGFG